MLDLQLGTLFERFLAEASKSFQDHEVDIKGRNEAIGLLHHKSYSVDLSVNLIHLGLTDVVSPQGRGLDRINDTDLMTTTNKETK